MTVEIALATIGAIAFASTLYCFVMLCTAWLAGRRQPLAKADGLAITSFCILIPAHNEEMVVESTLRSVAALNYPGDLWRCVVIADNCTDSTAQLASAALPRAEVLQRTNTDERGKGYALNWALEKILTGGDADPDAVVIIDADTQIDTNFLIAMDSSIRACDFKESKRFVAQGLYQVQNAADHWRTALMAGALSLVHYVRPAAREFWQTSVGLKGNGMCFASDVLRHTKWRGGSLTEDIEYGIDILEAHGIRVRFVPEAVVVAQMPTDSATSSGQRKRWEGGRNQVIRTRTIPLLLSGIASGSKAKIDAALDLCCPPLAQLASLLMLWGILVALGAIIGAPAKLFWLASWATTVALFGIYVVGGFKVGHAPKLAYKALGMALVYIPWKLATMAAAKFSSKRNVDWVRTERKPIEPIERDKPSDSSPLGATGK